MRIAFREIYARCMPMNYGSDGFLHSMPGICAECFAAQTGVPHPPFYYCVHNGWLAVKIGGAWKTARVLAPEDLARAIEETAKG
jgi:hypothetical protein